MKGGLVFLAAGIFGLAIVIVTHLRQQTPTIPAFSRAKRPLVFWMFQIAWGVPSASAIVVGVLGILGKIEIWTAF
jgi:hypothetical protein